MELSPQQKKQAKMKKLRAEIADLRRQKNELRAKVARQELKMEINDLNDRLASYDDRITTKLQRLRDVAMDTGKAVGKVAAAPAIAAKRVWDDWRIG